MRKQWSAAVLVVALMPSVASAEPRSGLLALVGVGTAVAGVITAFPQGETVRVLGDSYCVNDNPAAWEVASIDYGACSKGPMARKVGLIMLGSGVAMTLIGLQNVTVSPMLGKDVKGVSGKVVWGKR